MVGNVKRYKKITIVHAESIILDSHYIFSFEDPASIHSIGPRQAPYWTPAEPGKISVNETANITLSCNSGGEPAPFINWTRINRNGDVMENVSLAGIKAEVHFFDIF